MPPEGQVIAMGSEDLLKLLREQGLDDAGIKQLLSDTLASLEGSAEDTEAAEKQQASELLGVEF